MKPEPAWWAEVRRLRAAGLTYARIAETCGCHVATVNYILNPGWRASANRARQERDRLNPPPSRQKPRTEAQKAVLRAQRAKRRAEVRAVKLAEAQAAGAILRRLTTKEKSLRREARREAHETGRPAIEIAAAWGVLCALDFGLRP